MLSRGGRARYSCRWCGRCIFRVAALDARIDELRAEKDALLKTLDLLFVLGASINHVALLEALLGARARIDVYGAAGSAQAGREVCAKRRATDVEREHAASRASPAAGQLRVSTWRAARGECLRLATRAYKARRSLSRRVSRRRPSQRASPVPRKAQHPRGFFAKKRLRFAQLD